MKRWLAPMVAGWLNGLVDDADKGRLTGARRWELLLLLGALTAFAPLAIDMYLPALPGLEVALGATGAEVQRTLATFFLGFSMGQIAFGPVIDRFGRRGPLLAGLGIYVGASALCALSESAHSLAVMRFFQAWGACSGGVIARAIVRDVFPVGEIPRVFSNLILVMGLAPMLAPLAGGMVLRVAGWEWIFWVMSIAGSVALIAVWFRLEESLDPGERREISVSGVVGVVRMLLWDRSFLANAMVGGLSMAGMFSYITTSPFIFIQLRGLTESEFGLLFGGNALGFVLVAQVNGRVQHLRSPAWLVLRGGLCQLVAAVLLTVTAWTGFGGTLGIVVPLFLFIAMLGFVMPNSSALAMARHAANAGMASALMGTIQFGLAAVTSGIVSAAHGGSALVMAVPILVCVVLALVFNGVRDSDGVAV